MYGCVAESNSELVLLELAPDSGERSPVNESASVDSTPVAPLGSAAFESTLGSPTLASTRLGTTAGSHIGTLLDLSEARFSHSTHRALSSRHFAGAGSCHEQVLYQDAPLAPRSACASLSSPRVEFFPQSADQEIG